VSTFVDTSVVIPLIEMESNHHLACRESVERALANNGPIVVSDIVYVEMSVAMKTKADADAVIARFGFVRCGYSDEALYRASEAFRVYRANGGPREHLLPDFLVGALADVEAEELLTRDPARIRTYFPRVSMIHP